MAGNLLSGYGTSNQTITITLNSLANAAGRVATAIDNTSNKFTDAALFIKTKTGTVAGNKRIVIYGIGTADGGTTYTDNTGGSDAAVSVQPVAAPFVKSFFPLASTTAYYFGPMSVANAFGFLPDHWSFALWNDGGGILSGTVTDHGAWYQGVYGTYT